MHDALARQYTPDSLVEDVDDRSHPPPQRTKTATVPPIARNRVDTEELGVHVYIPDDGSGRPPGWHRAHATELETSCSTEEKPVPISYMKDEMKNRREIKHPLPPCECWTTAERREADRRYREDYGADFKR